MSDKPEQQIMGKLERVFKKIYQERMADLPMVNKQLDVHAIGFQPWNGSYLGVLSTPWFMNLMLLPGEQQDWSTLQELSKQSHILPSGRYQFIVGDEPEIGKYQMCSLFSPVFEFADDAAAMETARIIMHELMNPDNQEELHIQPQQMQQIWHGEVDPELTHHVDSTVLNDDEISLADTTSEQPLLHDRLDQPLSRRQLLRGKLGRGKS